MQNNNSFGSAIGELGHSVKHLIQSELELSKAEIRESSGRIGKDAMKMGFFGSLAALGILPLMAFLVIAIGNLIGSYVWSSLIVAILCLAIGSGSSYAVYSKMSKRPYTLPRTRDSMKRETEHLSHKVTENVQEIRNSVQRRAS